MNKEKEKEKENCASACIHKTSPQARQILKEMLLICEKKTIKSKREMASDWRQWRSKVLQGWEVEEILGDAIVEGGAGSLLSLPPEVLLPLVLGRLSPRELLLNVALVSRAFCLLAHGNVAPPPRQYLCF
jgi:hypothetical protein